MNPHRVAIAVSRYTRCKILHAESRSPVARTTSPTSRDSLVVRVARADALAGMRLAVSVSRMMTTDALRMKTNVEDASSAPTTRAERGVGGRARRRSRAAHRRRAPRAGAARDAGCARRALVTARRPHAGGGLHRDPRMVRVSRSPLVLASGGADAARRRASRSSAGCHVLGGHRPRRCGRRSSARRKRRERRRSRSKPKTRGEHRAAVDEKEALRQSIERNEAELREAVEELTAAVKSEVTLGGQIIERPGAWLARRVRRRAAPGVATVSERSTKEENDMATTRTATASGGQSRPRRRRER